MRGQLRNLAVAKPFPLLPVETSPSRATFRLPELTDLNNKGVKACLDFFEEDFR